MFDRYHHDARLVLKHAREAALGLCSSHLGTEHILFGLLDPSAGRAAELLAEHGVTRAGLDALVAPHRGCTARPPLGQLCFTTNAKALLQAATRAANELQHEAITPLHLLVGLVRGPRATGLRCLELLGTTSPQLEADALTAFLADGVARRRRTKTPALDAFTRDLVAAARAGELEGGLGRAPELEVLLSALAARRSALLVGRPGVGRRALVRLLAHALARGEVPLPLRDARLLALDGTALRARRRAQGRLEERVLALRTEVERLARAHQPVILVADDPSDLLADGVLAGLLPVLEAGELRCVLRVDAGRVPAAAALRAAFEAIELAPLGAAEVTALLRGALPVIADRHRVRLDDDALAAALAAVPAVGDGRLAQAGACLALLEVAAARTAGAGPVLPREVAALDEARVACGVAKELAVAQHEFERAAALRAQIDDLTVRREAAFERWRLLRADATPVVTAALVAAVACERDRAWARVADRSASPRVAVLLPTDPTASVRYEVAIAPALRALGCAPLRAVDPYAADAPDIADDVSLLLADASGRDPGVAFALGRARARGVPTLALVHDPGDLPAELRAAPQVAFDPLEPRRLRVDLEDALRALLPAPERSGPTA